MSAKNTAAQTQNKPKLLIVGPDEVKMRGGITTVITGMRNSEILNEHFDVTVFASCINGSLVQRLAYTFCAYLRFLFCFSRYDVFHLHVASYGSTFRKMYYVKLIQWAHKKVVLHLHSGKYLIFYEGLSPKKQKKVVRFLQSADAVIALSDDWKDKFEATFGLRNCITIPNGVDTKLFATAHADPSTVATKFLFLGRLSEAKGIYDLIDAVALVKQKGVAIHCVLAGDGDMPEMTALIAQKGLQDYFTLAGWVAEPQKLAYLQACGTLVLPSHGEALPMAILEAMAAGKGIVSTTVGAIPEVVSEENGILIAPKAVKALADAMIKCATDVAYLQTISANNLQKIEENYSRTKMDKQLKHCLEQVLLQE